MADQHHLERRLRALAAMKLFLEDATTEAVLAARAAGLKSEAIGEALGVTYQAVQRTWPPNLVHGGDRLRHRRRGEFSLRTLDAVDRTYIGQAALDLYVSALQPQQLWPWTTAIREHLSLELKRRRSESSPLSGTTLFTLTEVGITIRCVEPSATLPDGATSTSNGGEIVLSDALNENAIRKLTPTPDLSNSDPNQSLVAWQRRVRDFVTSAITEIIADRATGVRTNPLSIDPQSGSTPASEGLGDRDLFTD